MTLGYLVSIGRDRLREIKETIPLFSVLKRSFIFKVAGHIQTIPVVKESENNSIWYFLSKMRKDFYHKIEMVVPPSINMSKPALCNALEEFVWLGVTALVCLSFIENNKGQ